MKERPILFSGPMVRALLDGTKTQTRRAVNPQPKAVSFAWLWLKKQIRMEWGEKVNPTMMVPFCPYGQPGDRLWVKETFFPVHKWKHAPLFAAVEPDFLFRVDYDHREPKRTILGCHHWMPSIFMPRKASRITLEIVSVRVERLNEISEADAIAEGLIAVPKTTPNAHQFWRDYRLSGDGTFCVDTARDSYRTLWESINGAGSWALNPWVWVVEFRRVEA